MIFKLLTVLIPMSMVSAGLNLEVRQFEGDNIANENLLAVAGWCDGFHFGKGEEPSELKHGIVICKEPRENLQYYCDSVVKSYRDEFIKDADRSEIEDWDEPNKFADKNGIEHECKIVRIHAKDPKGSDEITRRVLGVQCPKSKRGRTFTLFRSLLRRCFIVCLKKELEYRSKPVAIYGVRERPPRESGEPSVPQALKTAQGESSEPVPEAIKTAPGESNILQQH